MKVLLLAVVVAVLAACSSPTAPAAKSAGVKTAPDRVSNSRYILISGVWTCVEGCEAQ